MNSLLRWVSGHAISTMTEDLDPCMIESLRTIGEILDRSLKNEYSKNIAAKSKQSSPEVKRYRRKQI